MIEKIDSGVLAAHQWVIDKTQIDPEKAALFFMRLILVLFLVRAMILASKEEKQIADWVSIGLTPLMLWATFQVYGMAKTGAVNAACRVFLVAMAATPYTPTAHGIATEVQSIVLFITMYLCICAKPKPPKRKHSLKESTV